MPRSRLLARHQRVVAGLAGFACPVASVQFLRDFSANALAQINVPPFLEWPRRSCSGLTRLGLAWLGRLRCSTAPYARSRCLPPRASPWPMGSHKSLRTGLWLPPTQAAFQETSTGYSQQTKTIPVQCRVLSCLTVNAPLSVLPTRLS